MSSVFCAAESKDQGQAPVDIGKLYSPGNIHKNDTHRNVFLLEAVNLWQTSRDRRED
jgi:hypothetical protein